VAGQKEICLIIKFSTGTDAVVAATIFYLSTFHTTIENSPFFKGLDVVTSLLSSLS
jgi:hypothetical protein